MWPYFLMFLIPALAALNENQRRPGESRTLAYKMPPAWVGCALLLIVLIGFRYEVGGDWGNYLKNLDEAESRNLTESLGWSDPAYRLLEWLNLQLGWGIAGVNIMTAVIFTIGLVHFCRHLPRPWLALTVAIPYLVVIVAMGYTRQALAIGCSMVGLVALGRQRVVPFLVWVVIAALFHRSAVLLLPIAALAATRRRSYVFLWVIVTTFVSYVAVLQDSVDAFREGYIEAEYASEGALIRLLMNLLPAVLLLVRRRKFAMSPAQLKLWVWFAVISVALLLLFFASPSSTAVDRIALYMLPLQLVVFSHLPEVWGSPRTSNRGLVAAVVMFYATVQIVWLNFAQNAYYWLPYRFYPAEMWL